MATDMLVNLKHPQALDQWLIQKEMEGRMEDDPESAETNEMLVTWEKFLFLLHNPDHLNHDSAAYTYVPK